MEPWWTMQQAGWIGGIGGGGLGSLLGIFGAIAGALAPRGRARGLVLGGFKAIMALGAVVLIGGVVAVAMGQPYHVYYPLLLMGVLLSVVSPVVYVQIRGRYRQAEIRKLEAEELRRSA